MTENTVELVDWPFVSRPVELPNRHQLDKTLRRIAGDSVHYYCALNTERLMSPNGSKSDACLKIDKLLQEAD